jgi:hypothetical protein
VQGADYWSRVEGFVVDSLTRATKYICIRLMRAPKYISISYKHVRPYKHPPV